MNFAETMERVDLCMQQHQQLMISLGSLIACPEATQKLDPSFRNDLAAAICNAAVANVTVALASVLTQFVTAEDERALFIAPFVAAATESPGLLQRYNLMAEEARKQLGLDG